MPHLRGMTWSHPRGFDSIRAATETFTAARPDVTVEWAARSLREFEEVPVEDLASRYDLLAIDHPFVGEAERTGALLKLDEFLPAEVLADLERHAVGPSHRSYAMAGHQWALAMDAAAQVSAYRPDLIPAGPPRTLDDAFDLLSNLPSGVTAELPANPVHLWSTFVSLCQHVAADRGIDTTTPGPGGSPAWWPDTGIEPDVAVAALDRVVELLRKVDPVSLTRDPIQTLDAMAAGAPIGYVPLVFGYSNYARPGYGEHLVRFGDAPSLPGSNAGTMAGGVGLAVSARCSHPEDAVEFAAWVVSPDCQRGPYLQAGGQPGDRRAWTDTAANAATNGFFEDTLATLDASFLRARNPGYPAFQHQGGELLHQGIRTAARNTQLVRELRELWRRTVTPEGFAG